MKKPFRPNLLPVKMNQKDIIEILKLEGEARAKVEKFNSILERSIIKKELLMLFSMKESIQSTRIEGTQASFSDVIEAGTTGKKTKDVDEVMNYYEALSKAELLLKANPISKRMFLQIHEIILRDSRDQNRSPGEYRQIQNFIGPTSSIQDASYIPPEPQLINEYMGNLEKCINEYYEDDFGLLSRAAIIHGQFETIHPFLDGNGRLGRILIIIYLLDKGIIRYPSFFVSEELEKNKFKYYALLNGLRLEEPKWKEWIMFFLESSVNQAERYIEKLESIENLYNKLDAFATSKNMNKEAISFIFNKPIFTIISMQEGLGVSYNTARRYSNNLVDASMVFDDDKKRNKMFYFYDLINILQN